MCCFSRPVVSVRATNIFARPGNDDRQFLVYSMTVHAKQDLAMVLPLPVKIGTGEKGVSFINLIDYPDFFDDMLKGFPVPVTAKESENATRTAAAPLKSTLEVIRVGNFEASFVPTMKDFSRLDERFRISDKAWRKLPDYKDFGFAVFKLKAGALKVHPMALSFPRRDTKSLFFPTVHIHDGDVQSKAKFDHTLYCQPGEHQQVTVRDWRESEGNAGRFMKVDKTKGLILAGHHSYKKEMRGNLPNRDTHVAITI